MEMPDGTFYFYRMGYGSGSTTGCYLQVLVKYDKSQSGAVHTAWFVRTIIEGGTVKWFKIS